MATKIRLMRMGRKKRPFYRIVVADSRTRRDGAFIEIIGTYNPLPNETELKIDEEKALKWLSVGAIPTDTAKSLMSKLGIIKKFAENKVKAGK
ncbi:30S ribosomal protein S16 [Mucispirillum schaedleri]|uniref:Small ribosomal subunit protein bS16 n=1 Tax=Mucispirillum schaedleri ASF457 TaxID=1379858 RepID=V2PWT1_9BACT|nr:30S ribosomal protein S16 [Mucispirillum schaedleri]USF24854.1 30S ribosomal protein S16 [Mucispirillum schaedleri ASF457]SIW07654.1 30S ribosomal subunit protein S16 [Mucispirillum schaedleri ASF457]